MDGKFFWRAPVGAGGSAASRWPARAEDQGFLQLAPLAPSKSPCNIFRVGYHSATGTSAWAAPLGQLAAAGEPHFVILPTTEHKRV